MMALAGCGSGSHEDEQTGPAVTVRWAPSTSDVVGYNVYRVSPGGVSGKLTTQIVRDTKFVDSTVEVEHFYSYFVTSVNAKGLESDPSERIDITVPKPEPTSALSRFFARIRGARSNTPVP
jgi:fibronectin type 3 domain-containing protein